ncbi:hypothetical protein VTK56DRAFT_3081 [Thermocarpiscus australiensis]
MAPRPQLEARSLSAINYLAANPPQYPDHPEVRESLTLYISRVPGTQDIILSTFRPQKRSVTVEDITNSLYYIHLDSPNDELLAGPQRLENAASPRTSSESATSTIPRKPLPASAKVPKVESSAPSSGVSSAPTAPQGPANCQSDASGDLAGAATAESQRPGDTVEGYRENPMFRKRRSGAPSEAPVLSPRPPAMPPPPATSTKRKPVNNPGPPGTLLGSNPDTPTPTGLRAQERPVTPKHSKPRPVTLHAVGQAASVTSPTSRLKVPSSGKAGSRPSSASFSLTIIRRDPTSGSQWNVGKVSSFQTNVPTPDRADPSLDPYDIGVLRTHKIDICLETSGYAKYRNMPTRASVEAYRPTSEHSFTQQVLSGAAAGPGADTAAPLKPAAVPIRGPAEECFSRQVVMSYCPTWKSNLKKAFHHRDRPGSSGAGEAASPERLAQPSPIHARHGSASTIGSVDSADGGHSPTLITQPGPGLKPKGYVFLSPWDGRCEFRTSTNGRSLKCRHILDSSARLDPREVAQNIRGAQAMGRSRGDELSSALLGAKPVSELRFNLPNKTPPPRASDRNSGSKGGRWDPGNLSAHFSKLLHRDPRSSDEEQDDEDDYGDYYDDYENNHLSLGREKAGGGVRGKSAKLGKLIIHDEGLKMLDLVVAANIGVWWTTWGRES